MKKLAKVLMALTTTALLFSLVACGGAEQDVPSWLDDGTQDTTASADEGEGRLLVYDDHGIKVYASIVEFVSGREEQYAQISLYYKVVNSTDELCWVTQSNVAINGTSLDIPAGSFGALIVLKNGTSTDDRRLSVLDIRAKSFNSTITKREDGKYEIDRSIAYTITGEFEIDFVDTGNKPDKGTFTLTIPANFPEDTFRTDEVWTSIR